MEFTLLFFHESVVSDLIAGLVGSGIVGIVAVAARRVGQRARRIAELLGWPAVAAVFLAVSLASAVIRGGGQSVVVLGTLLVVAALVMLLRFGPVRFEHAMVHFIQAYPFRIIALIFFLATVVLFFTDVEGSEDSPGRSDPVFFVVDLADDELLIFSQILDDIEDELGSEVFLVPVDSSRNVARLDKMRATDSMMWDLIAVDNNILAILAEKDLVEELGEYAEDATLLPASLRDPLRALTRYDDKFLFVPFRPNVKIEFYDQEVFTRNGLSPPRDSDDFRHVAEVLMDRAGEGRVAIQGAPGKTTAVTVFEIVTTFGGNPTTLADRGSEAAFEFMEDLWSILNRGSAVAKFDTANELLIDDAVDLVDNWTFAIGVVIPQRPEIATYSGWKGPAGNETHVLGGDVLAIPKGAPHAEQAAKLIELLMSAETQQALVDALRWPSARNDVHPRPDDELAEYFAAVDDALAFAVARPATVAWLLVEEVLEEAFRCLIREPDSEGCVGTTLPQYSAQLLRIPPNYPGYTVQEGETLGELAERFGCPTETLALVNDITQRTSLSEGQLLLHPGGGC